MNNDLQKILKEAEGEYQKLTDEKFKALSEKYIKTVNEKIAKELGPLVILNLWLN